MNATRCTLNKLCFVGNKPLFDSNISFILQDKGKNALNLSNVSGIFHILIGGLVLSMIISLTQIVFKTKFKSRTYKVCLYCLCISFKTVIHLDLFCVFPYLNMNIVCIKREKAIKYKF